MVNLTLHCLCCVLVCWFFLLVLFVCMCDCLNVRFLSVCLGTGEGVFSNNSSSKKFLEHLGALKRAFSKFTAYRCLEVFRIGGGAGGGGAAAGWWCWQCCCWVVWLIAREAGTVVC